MNDPMEIARAVWTKWAADYGDRSGSATGPLIRTIAAVIEEAVNQRDAQIKKLKSALGDKEGHKSYARTP